jgi:hypothetical protein
MKCPGQDTQYWNADAIFETQCPACGHPMEFFKDDATRRCSGCGKKQVNPKMDFGCAAYCKFAEACLGTLPEAFVAQQEDLLKDRVAVEVKRHLGQDFKRISRAATRARFTESIGKAEQAELPVILCTAYLYELGEAAAGRILEKLGAKAPLAEAVATLLAQLDIPDGREPGPDAPLNLRVLWDADMLTHMTACEKKNSLDPNPFAKKIDRVFLTGAGRKLAKET